MSAFYSVKADFAARNQVLSLTLGALSLRERFLELLDEYAPALAIDHEAGGAHEPGLEIVLGLIGVLECIHSVAERTAEGVGVADSVSAKAESASFVTEDSLLR